MKTVALIGNPNSGKTTLFNALTGLRQKTANYPGVTVEKKEGQLLLSEKIAAVNLIDLPGTYSLLTRSLDEEVVYKVLMGLQQGTPEPDLAVIVIDATNLERNLFFASQVMETGIPSILVLNMWDVVQSSRTKIDLEALANAFYVPVVTTVGNRRGGIDELKKEIEKQLLLPHEERASHFKLHLPKPVRDEIEHLIPLIESKRRHTPSLLKGEALRLLGDTRFRNPLFLESGELKDSVAQSRKRLMEHGIHASSVEAETRYTFIQALCRRAVHKPSEISKSLSEKIDAFLTHKYFGFLTFFVLMALMFQAIFSWASVPMNWLDTLSGAFGSWVGSLLPEGQLKSLVVDGMIAGVGSVIVFLPQIMFLFFFIALFEDSGYMARAAFVLDRVMRKVGLNGKSFIPLLSSFACAVPAIMSTRTIEDRNDRFATILVAPLMSCSARLPVYTLMIAAFIPNQTVLGFLNLKGIVLFSMYALSITAGLCAAAIFRKTLLKGSKSPFVLELPPYRMPDFRTVFTTMLDRAKQFVYRAGTIIFMLSILLWFLASYPRQAPNVPKSEQIQSSYAGQLGKLIEPAIKPLGFDWRIGIGLVASFAAREVLVSTLAIVYNVNDEGNSSADLIERLQHEVSPETGKPIYNTLTAISLMVFFVLACQCVSTIAIVKRETNSWRWPIFMVSYMTLLAWTGSFLVFQIGRLFYG